MCIWLYSLLRSLLINKKNHKWTQEKLHTQILFIVYQSAMFFLSSFRKPLRPISSMDLPLTKWKRGGDFSPQVMRPSPECRPTLLSPKVASLCPYSADVSCICLKCLFAYRSVCLKLQAYRKQEKNLPPVLCPKNLQKHLKNSFNNA